MLAQLQETLTDRHSQFLAELMLLYQLHTVHRRTSRQGTPTLEPIAPLTSTAPTDLAMLSPLHLRFPWPVRPRRSAVSRTFRLRHTLPADERCLNRCIPIYPSLPTFVPIITADLFSPTVRILLILVARC